MLGYYLVSVIMTGSLVKSAYSLETKSGSLVGSDYSMETKYESSRQLRSGAPIPKSDTSKVI